MLGWWLLQVVMVEMAQRKMLCYCCLLDVLRPVCASVGEEASSVFLKLRASWDWRDRRAADWAAEKRLQPIVLDNNTRLQGSCGGTWRSIQTLSLATFVVLDCRSPHFEQSCNKKENIWADLAKEHWGTSWGNLALNCQTVHWRNPVTADGTDGHIAAAEPVWTADRTFVRLVLEMWCDIYVFHETCITMNTEMVSVISRSAWLLWFRLIQMCVYSRGVAVRPLVDTLVTDNTRTWTRWALLLSHGITSGGNYN